MLDGDTIKAVLHDKYMPAVLNMFSKYESKQKNGEILYRFIKEFIAKKKFYAGNIHYMLMLYR